MPELPEVETIARELGNTITGDTIQQVQILRASSLKDISPAQFTQQVVGHTFGLAYRKGKYLLLPLQSKKMTEKVLVSHLGMTGKWIIDNHYTQPHSHHRALFFLSSGRALIFQDMRCFGTLVVFDQQTLSEKLTGLGPEPLSAAFTASALMERLQKSAIPLKPWLMDQSKIAGIGNIYAAEILFDARLSPVRQTNTLTESEATTLHKSILKVLQLALECNGTTISDYRRVDEKQGQFQQHLQVYGRKDQPCFVCGNILAYIRQQQRSTQYCPTCQQ